MVIISRANAIEYSTWTWTKNYTRFKPYLRKDFSCTCGYCSVWESTSGGWDNYHVDHILPKSNPLFEHLELDPNNMVYSCSDCNLLKGADVVDNDLAFTGVHYIDPCKEDFNDHFNYVEGELIPKTDSALYMESTLQLNRPQAVMTRQHQLIMEDICNNAQIILADKDKANDDNDDYLITSKEQEKLLKIYIEKIKRCYDRNHNYFKPDEFPCNQM